MIKLATLNTLTLLFLLILTCHLPLQAGEPPPGIEPGGGERGYLQLYLKRESYKDRFYSGGEGGILVNRRRTEVWTFRAGGEMEIAKRLSLRGGLALRRIERAKGSLNLWDGSQGETSDRELKVGDLSFKLSYLLSDSQGGDLTVAVPLLGGEAVLEGRRYLDPVVLIGRVIKGFAPSGLTIEMGCSFAVNEKVALSQFLAAFQRESSLSLSSSQTVIYRVTDKWALQVSGEIKSLDPPRLAIGIGLLASDF